MMIGRRAMLSGIAGVAAWAAPAAADAKTANAPRQAIQAVLDDSARGWNTGDLDRFMACYERGAATTYVSSGKVVIGFDAIRATYGARFAGGKGTMGTLSLAIIGLRAIGTDHAYVIGRFHLRGLNAGTDIEGLTTLLFRRSGGTWRIVADHS